MQKTKISWWARGLGSGGLVAAVGGILYSQWDRILAHPFASALVGLGSAFLGIVLAFGRKVREKLEDKWAQSVADWLDAQIRLYGSLLFSGFRRRYYRQLVYRHRVFNVRGLRTRGDFTLELEKVFVDLNMAPRGFQSMGSDPHKPERPTGRRSIWELLVSRNNAYRSLVIIGPPGSGKTTLLQHLTLVLAANKQRRHDWRCRAFVPILLSIRSHVDAIVSNGSSSLASIVSDLETKEGLNPPREWFDRKLRKGKALVLLDGLDEVADPTKRRQVVKWVARQVERYGRTRFLVTSRPHGYKSNPLPVATVLEVQPFTLEQVERFVGSWYRANEILSFGKEDAGVRQHSERQAKDLMKRLINSPRLTALAVNPLLLTMIAVVHRYRGALPGRRVELYGEICDVLLGHWQAAKGLVAQFTPAQCRAVLQPLAFHLMISREQDIALPEAEKIIHKPLVGVQGAGGDGAAFLTYVRKGSGLLVEREEGRYSFAHLTFQEYLAAAHALEMHDNTCLLEVVDDPWWSETIQLYAAQSDATAIIRACLDFDQPNVQALTLAYQCLSEARTVDAEIRKELEQELAGGLEAQDPQRSRLAAEVALALRLRELLRLTGTLEIDTRNISCAEYQLFIDDKLREGTFYQPDHWRGTHFARGEAKDPVAGIRSADALAFCEWLTEKAEARGEPFRYRLPRSNEMVVQQPDEERGLGGSGRDRVGTWTDGQPSRVVGVSAEFLNLNRRHLSDNIKEIFAVDIETARAIAGFQDLYPDEGTDRGETLALGRVLDSIFAMDSQGDIIFALSFVVEHMRIRPSLLDEMNLDSDVDVGVSLGPTAEDDSSVPQFRAGDLLSEHDKRSQVAETILRIWRLILGRRRLLSRSQLAHGLLSLNLANAFDASLDRRVFRLGTSLNLGLFRDLAIIVDRRTRKGKEDDSYRFETLMRDRTLDRLRDLAPELLPLVTLDAAFDCVSNSSGRLDHTLSRARLYSLLLTAVVPVDSQAFQILLGTYRSLTVLRERLENRLPAWEGIRIVRERVGRESISTIQ